MKKLLHLGRQTVFHFKTGDKVVGVGDEENPYSMTCDGWRGVVVDIEPDPSLSLIRVGKNIFDPGFQVRAAYFMPDVKEDDNETEN